MKKTSPQLLLLYLKKSNNTVLQHTEKNNVSTSEIRNQCKNEN